MKYMKGQKNTRKGQEDKLLGWMEIAKPKKRSDMDVKAVIENCRKTLENR